VASGEGEAGGLGSSGMSRTQKVSGSTESEENVNFYQLKDTVSTSAVRKNL